MKHELNTAKFSKAIKQKRIIDLGIDLRDASKSVGVGFATLSRCENGNTPDLVTYANICKWLGVSLDTYIVKAKTNQLN